MSRIYGRLRLAGAGLIASLGAAVLVLVTSAGGCVLPGEREGPRSEQGAAVPRPRAELSILTWNVEWFQHPDRGPPDDALQFESVLDVLHVLEASGASLVALQEVSEPARFYDLLDRLPSYAGVITDHTWPQQLALLYRAREFALVGTRALLGLDDAGRPPLAVELRHATGARVLAVVVHAKAGHAPNDHARRERFARGLVGELAGERDALLRFVLGDFNDQLGGSLVPDYASPYTALLDDAGLLSPTAALERGSEPSTIWGDTVDHILVDPGWLELASSVAADVLRDELLAEYPRFVEDVSDHFPVRVRLLVRAPDSAARRHQSASSLGAAGGSDCDCAASESERQRASATAVSHPSQRGR